MSRRCYDTDTQNLSYVWVADIDLRSQKSFEAEYSDNDSEVQLFCGKELYDKLECYNSSPTKEIVADALRWLALFDRGDAGHVEVSGWYEAPSICWSDPSCSDAGDGDVTGVRVKLADGLEDMFRANLEEYFKDISELEQDQLKDMDMDAIIERCRVINNADKHWSASAKKVLRQFPKFLAEELYADFDGTDIL